MYHLTCHDCPTEELYRREALAAGRKLAHHDLLGHHVEYAEVA